MTGLHFLSFSVGYFESIKEGFLFFGGGLCVCIFLFFRAVPRAYGSSQARGQSELQLPAYTTATAMPDPSSICIPEFTAMPDP